MMTVDRKLLEILVCPISKQPVFVLSQTRLDKLNALIESGEINSLDGEQVKTPLTQALITKNEKTLYPVEEGVPIMLESKGIGTEQIKNW